MDITISDNLKKYRKSKGNTQEELAEHLNISIQAVSKWERNEGFPDITLLPKIAMYYDVSVDDLLGVGQMRIDKKVAEYLEKSDPYERISDWTNYNLLWAEAFKEFPNNYTVMSRYWETIPNERMDEKLAMADRVFNESDNPSHRYNVIRSLCHMYADLGNEEKAIEYAKKAPIIDISRDYLLTHIYKGEKLTDHVQSNLTCYVDLMNKEIYRLIWHGDFNNNERRKARERCLKLFDWLFEDGDYGFFCCMVDAIYADLALLDAVDEDFKATDKNIDSVIKNLSLMAECAIRFITQEDFKHTSFLVNRRIHNSGHKGYHSSSDNECRWALNLMQRDWFDLCREDERFKEIERRLAEYAN